MAKHKNRNSNRNKPGGGLYGGKAGEYIVQQDPQTYANALLAQGGHPISGMPADMQRFWNDQGFSNIYSDYQNALAGDEKLKFKDYATNTFGQGIGEQGLGVNTATTAPPTGKRRKRGKRRKQTGNPAAAAPGNPFAPPGTGAAPGTTPGGVDDATRKQNIYDQFTGQFLDFLSNDDPQNWFLGGMGDLGFQLGAIPADMGQFLANDYFAGQYANYLQQRKANPMLSFRDYTDF